MTMNEICVRGFFFKSDVKEYLVLYFEIGSKESRDMCTVLLLFVVFFMTDITCLLIHV